MKDIEFILDYKLPIGSKVWYKNKIIGVSSGWFICKKGYKNYITIKKKYEKLVKKEINQKCCSIELQLIKEGEMPSNLTKKVYTFVWPNDNMRYAEIVFDATAPSGWKFSHCSFSGVNQLYDLDDWEFIGTLADEIKALCKKEGVTL